MKFPKAKTLSMTVMCAFGSAVLTIGHSASATVPNVNDLISVGGSSTIADNYSQNPDISANGRYVVFASTATNLVTGDANGKSDIFLRDMQTSTTTAISVTAQSAVGNGDSMWPKISHNGRYVTFTSNASNLVAGDVNGMPDVFVRDVESGTTTIASKTASGMHADGSSEVSDISADGRFVVFHSTATDLVSPSPADSPQVYIKDLQTGAVKLLSKNTLGAAGNAASLNASINCSGNVVSFESAADNLVGGDNSHSWDVFVSHVNWSGDSVRGLTVDANATADNSEVSCDGNTITYQSAASNIVTNVSNPNNVRNVYSYDRSNEEHALISIANGNTNANNHSGDPVVSGDGRYIAFLSDAWNLTPNYLPSIGGTTSVFIRDIKTGTTELLTRNLDNDKIGGSQSPAISSDGSYVVFQNSVEALIYDPGRGMVSSDMNGYGDIYRSQTGH